MAIEGVPVKESFRSFSDRKREKDILELAICFENYFIFLRFNFGADQNCQFITPIFIF
ncbi:MAG: hypothetical protein ACPLW7_02315 [Minisyncoccia bacterium]